MARGRQSFELRTSSGALRPPHAGRPDETLEQRVERIEDALAASPRGERLIGDLRSELAEVGAQAERRSARMMHVVGELEKRLGGIEADVAALDVSNITTSWRKELQALEQRLRKELAEREAPPATTEETHVPIASLQVLIDRLDEIERGRDAVVTELSDLRESATASDSALNERLAELVAQIGASPEVEPSDDDSVPDWPSARAYVQLMVAVEGLQMRLAYHEKEVAELMSSRGVNERIEELNELLRRLETAENVVRGERDSMLDQLDRLASRVDYRLNKLETIPTAPSVETG